MPTVAEQQVLDKLNILRGNVQVVAQDLGVSESWVNRVKKNLWQPQDDALIVAEPDPDAEEHLSNLLPTNFKAVMALRDEAIEALRDLITEGMIDAKDLASVTRTLLKYERDVNKVASPAANVFQDNRQVHFITLVDKLADMDQDALRALSGVPEPMVIDATVEE